MLITGGLSPTRTPGEGKGGCPTKGRGSMRGHRALQFSLAAEYRQASVIALGTGKSDVPPIEGGPEARGWSRAGSLDRHDVAMSASVARPMRRHRIRSGPTAGPSSSRVRLWAVILSIRALDVPVEKLVHACLVRVRASGVLKRPGASCARGPIPDTGRTRPLTLRACLYVRASTVEPMGTPGIERDVSSSVWWTQALGERGPVHPYRRRQGGESQPCPMR